MNDTINRSCEPTAGGDATGSGTPTPDSNHRRRARDQRGEGVISTAIAVLVVAFIGIGLWQGFDAMVDSASRRTRAQVDQIGR